MDTPNPFLSHFGQFGPLWGQLWPCLGPILACSWPILAFCGPDLAVFGQKTQNFRKFFSCSKSLLKGSWGVFGHPKPIFVTFGPLWGQLWPCLGPILACSGPILSFCDLAVLSQKKSKIFAIFFAPNHFERSPGGFLDPQNPFLSYLGQIGPVWGPFLASFWPILGLT